MTGQNKSSNNQTKKNVWKYLSIGLMAILVVGISFPHALVAAAQPVDSVLSIVQDIQAKINDPTFGLEAIKNAINNGADQTSVNNLQTTANEIHTTQYVPFSATSSNASPVVCVPEGELSDTDDVVISSTADIMVTGVIVKPTSNIIEPDDAVTVRFIEVDGERIFLIGENLDPNGDTASNVAFDLMGQGEGFPHQLAGQSINFELLCLHDEEGDSNIEFDKIIVSGWKRAGSSVSVSYQE